MLVLSLLSALLVVFTNNLELQGGGLVEHPVVPMHVTPPRCPPPPSPWQPGLLVLRVSELGPVTVSKPGIVLISIACI